MKQKLLKSLLCLCLLLPACNNQQEKTSDKSTAEKTVPAAIVAAPRRSGATTCRTRQDRGTSSRRNIIASYPGNSSSGSP